VELVAKWHQDVVFHLNTLGVSVKIMEMEGFVILNCDDKFYVNLLSLQNNYHPQTLIELQTNCKQQGINLIQLWEDVWLGKKNQVMSRFSSFLGLNTKIHARSTKILPLNITQTIDFLNQHHLQGYVKTKYTFGLYLKEKLIGLASFSAPRVMKDKGANYQSAELVRFASKHGFTIVGGLSKLIKHFDKQVDIDDIMTYADRDWSLGKGYHRLGFQLSNITHPAFLYSNTQTLIRYFPHRLPKTILENFKAQNKLSLDDFLTQNNYIKVFNTGNLKYHLHLK
jgi:hypothetical protein